MPKFTPEAGRDLQQAAGAGVESRQFRLEDGSHGNRDRHPLVEMLVECNTVHLPDAVLFAEDLFVLHGPPNF